MITSEKVTKVIKNFESVLHLATREGHLNMGVGWVNFCNHNNDNSMVEYQCGTVHCHGGWYAIAKGLHLKRLVDFQDGSHRIARDLGFENDTKLLLWAHENPTIWGNEDGEYMFSNKKAFCHQGRPNGAKNLQDIIDHWKEVAGRLEEMENKRKKKKSPTYKNITKELAVLPVDEKSDGPVKIKTAIQTT